MGELGGLSRRIAAKDYPRAQILADRVGSGFTRQTLLKFVLPAILVIYFGSLTAAIRLSAGAYDWHRMSISWLLYPRNDPVFHLFASAAIAITGLLIVPIAGYMRMRMKGTEATFTNLGSLMLSLGALLLIAAGLIVSHPYAGAARFPRLHEMLARSAATALGMAMLTLWIVVLTARRSSSAKAVLGLRRLSIAWSLVVIPAILVLALRVLAYIGREWSGGFFRAIGNRSLWHLGLWEWIGSGAVFLFLLSSALFLPDHASE